VLPAEDGAIGACRWPENVVAAFDVAAFDTARRG
jgi:hypothetical protein